MSTANTTSSRPSAPPTTTNGRQFHNNRASALPVAGASRGVQQPTPQALPQRAGPSNIIVSPRQKENPVLKEIKNIAWELGDIAPDFVLGATTCALFLSLKYHKIHPEYIYGRIKALQGRYNLRIILVRVDITNHEETLKELSKTSIINNVTIVLCWSNTEAGRYLELFKMYENSSAAPIKAPPAQSHGDKLTEFITVPRGVNKTDALGLVSNFGKVRTAVNARPEEILLIQGWGEKKVKQWHNAVNEPFRARKATKRGLPSDDDLVPGSQRFAGGATFRDGLGGGGMGRIEHENVANRPPKRTAEDLSTYELDDEEDETLFIPEREPPAVSIPPTTAPPAPKPTSKEPEVSDGVLAALARFREQG
jgi:DNA excision repair protein ERCC-1